MSGMGGMNYAAVNTQHLAQQMFAMQGLTGTQLPLLQLNQQFPQAAIPLGQALGNEPGTATGKKRGRKKQAEEGQEPPKRQRSRKPPDAPKRPKSAYMFFLAEFREAWKADNPNSKKVADVAKAAGEVWRSMSAEKKADYEERSTGAKQAYAKAMQSYEEQHPKPVRRPVKIRDPAELKRPQSAYFFFLADFRDAYKKEHPTEQLQVAVLGKLAGEKWKLMTEEEKAPYEAQSSASKAEYAKQKMLTPEERRVYASMQNLQQQQLNGGGGAAPGLLNLQTGATGSHFPFGTSATAMTQVAVPTSMPSASQQQVEGLQLLQNFQHLHLLQNLQSNQALQAQAQAQAAQAQVSQAQALQAVQAHHAQAVQAQAVQAAQHAQVQAHMQAHAQAQADAQAQAQSMGLNPAYAAAAASQAQQAALMQSMLAHQVQSMGSGSPASSSGATGLQQLATTAGVAQGAGMPATTSAQAVPTGFAMDGQMATHSLLGSLGSMGGQQQMPGAQIKLDGQQ